MAVTTNYGLPKPVGTDYYDIEVFNAAMDGIDGQMKSNAGAAATAASMAASAQGTADDAANAAAAAQGIADDAAAGVEALEAINAPITTGGTAPAFTLTPDPVLSAYADGQTWTVLFHADGDEPTFNVSGLGAATLLEATGKAAKVKAGQIARVMRYGDSFFTVSGGGGLSLPDPIIAGDMRVYNATTGYSAKNTAYALVGAGYGFTAIKTGTYRVTYIIYGTNRGQYPSSYGYAKLQKNGVDVPNSEVSGVDGTIKSVDVELLSGDAIRMLTRSDSSSFTWSTNMFSVSVGSLEIQEELGKLITAL